MVKLIMVMFPLSEKKINFHCHTDLTNNGVQVRRKWEIITQRTLSILFVPTSCRTGSKNEGAAGEEVKADTLKCV